MFKRLTDEQIAEHAIVCWQGLEEHQQDSFRDVAEAQLTQDKAECEAEKREIFAELERIWSFKGLPAWEGIKSKYLGESDASK